MGFFKNLFGGRAASSSADFFTFTVRCDRCGESIDGKVNLKDDLSLDDEGGYHARKVLIGSGRCFQRIEVVLKFGPGKDLTAMHINGGTFE